MAYDRISVRGIIRDADKIFLVKHTKESWFRALPWGGMDPGEDAKTALQREITEELWIKATIWKLLYVQEFYDSWRNLNILEMFFEVTPSTKLESNSHLWTSHAHEIYKSEWVILGEVTLLPAFLTQELQKSTWTIFFSDSLQQR